MGNKSTLHLFIEGKEISITKDKLIVGSGDNCDIKLDHSSISHYHAMLIANPDGSLNILDLESMNGTFINGVKVKLKTTFFDGDKVSFGKLHCDVVETIAEAPIFKTDVAVEINSEIQNDKLYIPEKENETEILIDDEYCDIVFDDNQFIPLNTNPVSGLKVSTDHYVEPDDMEDAFPILEENGQQCIQVTTTLNGHMLEQYYYPIQDGTVYTSSHPKKNQVGIDILSSKLALPLFKLEGDTVNVEKLEGFEINQAKMSLNENSVVVLSRGTYQVFIEKSQTPGRLIQISSLRRDVAFYKDTAKKFAAVILPMLLLLLVDLSVDKQKPLKQLSIIYKKPTNSNVDGKKMASLNPNDLNKNTGHKDKKQPDKKLSHSKSGKQEKPKQAKAKKVAASKSKATKRAKAKTKSYNFKLATNVNSMFSNTKSVAVSNNNAPSTAKTTASVSGSLNTKVNGTSNSKVGQMGSDAAGRALASFGSKGLSSKSGRDTAYIQTKTVVLGSMDPELLRKILQQYLPQFRHCYQQELAYNADDIKGIVDLNFEISPSGKVGKAKVKAKDSRFSKKGLDCMKGVLAIIDFPKPKGGGRVAVRQPLSFFSEQEKG